MATTPFCSEELLYKKVASGDLSALGALYERNKEAVYYTFLGMIKDPATARDLTQDSFEALWTGRDHLLYAEKPAAYFRKLCRNMILRFIEARNNQRRIAVNIADRLPKAVNPYQEMHENETISLLNQSIEQLTPQRKEVVRKKQEKFTNREIAVEMKLSEETVKSHFSNALNDLRTNFKLLGA
ncbi:RNA polymerase sigma-70 factor (ECF subfamily) [Filimonas zeae]|uniref:RNA polymerase sigma-70 factor, ECF subfamily n=1 Tax=Filimonas zeae TaxID=1737353 RepID=A0A917IXA9_9BACT|nr:sigma-70 family RNA polymerase sigma factor [Filimonas zeae]MDR6339016.1 RNA polymerase sigma-70 factor (ECF subfamily) [Filimonas zeae]GGH65505.1 hypothetical protein GCM10011379_18710 [Filimonas zeae]